MKRCLVNGSEQSNLAASDRGLHYGDGLFETIAVIDGRPRHWQQHMQRLAQGCECLNITMPDVEQLFDDVARVTITLPLAVVKIIITRGSCGRGYTYDAGSMDATRIVASYEWPEYPENHYRQGVHLRICDTSISCQPALAGIKHLNRIENVLARNEWQDESFAEGLMLDSNGNVIEGTMSNLFWVEDGQLFTPALEHCGVHGIMRSRVIETAEKLGITHSQEDVGVDRLHKADELFVCNSVIGIWPAVLDGEPSRGVMTEKIMRQLADENDILFI